MIMLTFQETWRQNKAAWNWVTGLARPQLFIYTLPPPSPGSRADQKVCSAVVIHQLLVKVRLFHTSCSGETWLLLALTYKTKTLVFSFLLYLLDIIDEVVFPHSCNVISLTDHIWMSVLLWFPAQCFAAVVRRWLLFQCQLYKSLLMTSVFYATRTHWRLTWRINFPVINIGF